MTRTAARVNDRYTGAGAREPEGTQGRSGGMPRGAVRA